MEIGRIEFCGLMMFLVFYTGVEEADNNLFIFEKARVSSWRAEFG